MLIIILIIIELCFHTVTIMFKLKLNSLWGCAQMKSNQINPWRGFQLSVESN